MIKWVRVTRSVGAAAIEAQGVRDLGRSWVGRSEQRRPTDPVFNVSGPSGDADPFWEFGRPGGANKKLLATDDTTQKVSRPTARPSVTLQ